MSHIVQFSYRFNEDIKRIYECFSDFNLVSEMSFAHVMTNMKKIKGISELKELFVLIIG